MSLCNSNLRDGRVVWVFSLTSPEINALDLRAVAHLFGKFHYDRYNCFPVALVTTQTHADKTQIRRQL